MRASPLPNILQRRAFIVGAEPATQVLCREHLERHDFTVHVMDTGVAAVSAARAETPSVIFLQEQLPDAPGREVAGWLRSNPELRSTPIVMLGAENDDLTGLAKAQPTAILRTPLSVRAVERILQAIRT